MKGIQSWFSSSDTEFQVPYISYFVFTVRSTKSHTQKRKYRLFLTFDSQTNIIKVSVGFFFLPWCSASAASMHFFFKVKSFKSIYMRLILYLLLFVYIIVLSTTFEIKVVLLRCFSSVVELPVKSNAIRFNLIHTQSSINVPLRQVCAGTNIIIH